MPQKNKTLRTMQPLRTSRKRLKFKDASGKKQAFFAQCREYALQSNMRSKHCAVLEYNGNIITFSNNQYGADKTSFSLHAEQLVHQKFLKIQHKVKKRKKYNLWVFRHSETSGVTNSKPCSSCTKFIKESMPYVNKIYYSYDNTYYIREDKTTLNTQHISAGHRHRISLLKHNC